MSLSSSLFTGTSGLKNMGNALQVTGNNLSNLNTVGYKRGRATFADTLYESVATQGGSDQMGRGMAIGDVSQNFGQGSFESTGNTTDLSIGGDGFFVMRQSNSENTFYTRAGNFFFDKDGQLVNPEGYIVQGWELDEDTGDDVGAIGDVVLEAFTNPPKKSSQITAITNLDADADSSSIVLSNNWDSGEDTYMATNNYEYQTVMKVYDSLGSTHDISVFYDKKTGTEWEYLVACDPSEDRREGVQGTDSKGLLARGTITFSQSSGDILDMTMSEFTGRLGNFRANGVNNVDAVSYEIFNTDDMANDGLGFAFEFDGSEWSFSSDSLPESYSDANIIFSDNQEIQLILDDPAGTGTDPDIIFHLEQSAVATDSFGFDINNPNDLHVQGIEGTRYFGDTANDNTTLEINDPSVMTQDTDELGIVWVPNAGSEEAGEWRWSNPQTAYDYKKEKGTIQESDSIDLISGTDNAGNKFNDDDLVINATGTDYDDADTTIDVNTDNIKNFSMVSDIQLRYNGTNSEWDWNDDIKVEDIQLIDSDNTFVPSNEPTVTVSDSLVVDAGAIAASKTTLTWNAAVAPATVGSWSLTTAGTGDNLSSVSINSSDESEVELLFDYGADGSYTTTFDFGTSVMTDDNDGQAFAFEVIPTPPREYADAALEATVSSDEIKMDLVTSDNNYTDPHDLKIELNAGGAAGETVMFTIDPNVPPEEYEDATLKGDQEEAVIDIDGSGNDDDDDDIRFTFDDSLKFGSNTHPYDDRSSINFQIVGSTAWTEMSKSDIESIGYFSFNTDFLGGDYGVTENDIELNLGSVYQNNAFINDSLSTTQFSKSSSTIFQDADGYSAGDLEGVDVASDGVMTGIYSNGQLIPLFRVGLASFRNNYGLSNEGGNLFMETRSSGTAITNKPGENGLGTIAPNSLEMSNVDISEEFVNMITNQRGFQANSKTVTTVDDMMQTVIQMKR